MSKLFSSASLNAFDVQNRIVMAPMTRARSSQPGNVPNEMMAEYYAQRTTHNAQVQALSSLKRRKFPTIAKVTHLLLVFIRQRRLLVGKW